MLSIRTLARSAPRTLTRVASASLRQSARPSAFVKSSTISALRSSTAAAFSTTSVARRAAAATESELDDELSAKLESEIQIEEDIKANEQQPASIKDFLENTPFELIDTPGQEVVKLTRSFGEEKITVSFSIADITNYDPYSEDAALEDEELQDESKPSSKQQEDAEDLEEDLDEEPAAPINLSIVIEKPGKTAGALNIDATAQDGAIVVENLFFYEDAKVARIDSPDAAQKRADVLMERFLEERGINQAMAIFVPDFVDVKEQREYLRWLNNVKTFVDA
ncbi:Mitochondrial acidic MAM33-like protein [Cladobotryum mycophilum]|uniref:Mitochondrial acidic MAM33-like protein n=1 Tax=Cladobotryum mycophilum TaxID=491253 RepID=A0ABR0STY0_9HYPO